MPYQDLHDLFRHSASTRRYFLSLPVDLQMQVSEHREHIHTAEDLRNTVYLIGKYNHAVAVSELLFSKR